MTGLRPFPTLRPTLPGLLSGLAVTGLLVACGLVAFGAASDAGLIVYQERLKPAHIGAGGGHAYVYNIDNPLIRLGLFTTDSDDVGGDYVKTIASTLTLLEDGKPLGPAHSPDNVVHRTGAGAFSHCVFGRALLFSASDNSDPGQNGRHYLARYPIKMAPPLLKLFSGAQVMILVFAILLVALRITRLSRSFEGSAASERLLVEVPSVNRSWGLRFSRLQLTLLAIVIVLAAVLAQGLPAWMGGNDVTRLRLNPPDRAPSFGESVVYWKVRSLLLDPPPRKDLVVIGDSSSLMSVVPKRLAAASGLSAISLGVDNSWTLDFQNDMLKLYLERNPPPKVVIAHFALVIIGLVVDSHPYYQLDNRDNARAWLSRVTGHQNVLPATFDINLAAVVSGFHRGLDLILRPDRDPYDNANLDQPHLFPWGTFPSDRELARQMADSDGLVRNPSKPIPAPVQNMDKTLNWFLIPALKDLLALSRQFGFAVLVAVNPVPEAWDSPEARHSAARLTDQLRELMKTYPKACVVEPLLRFYPPATAFDGAHLIGDGPDRNSDFLAGALRTSPCTASLFSPPP